MEAFIQCVIAIGIMIVFTVPVILNLYFHNELWNKIYEKMKKGE